MLHRRRHVGSLLALCLAAAPRPSGAAPVLHPAREEPPVQHLFSITPVAELRVFSWKEDLPGTDQQALSETGALFGFGGQARLAFGPARRAFVDLDLRLYLGSVDYDGQTINARTAIHTTTSYLGFEASPTAGFVFTPGRGFRITPQAGAGLELWSRDLDSGGARGYVEHYRVFLLQAAARGDYQPSPQAGVHLMLGLKMPVAISEDVDLSRQGVGPRVELSPGLSPRLLVEAGTTLYGVDLSIYFETWTLPQSDPDPNGLLQPRSTRQLVGVRVGYVFGLD